MLVHVARAMGNRNENGDEVNCGSCLARIYIDDVRFPTLSSTDDVVCQNLAEACLSRVIWTEHEHSWGIGFDILESRRGTSRTQGTDSQLLECNVHICIDLHGCFIGNVLCGWFTCNVHHRKHKRA